MGSQNPKSYTSPIISPKNKIGTLSADQHWECRFSTHFFYIYINYELLTTSFWNSKIKISNKTSNYKYIYK